MNLQEYLVQKGSGLPTNVVDFTGKTYFVPEKFYGSFLESYNEMRQRSVPHFGEHIAKDEAMMFVLDYDICAPHEEGMKGWLYTELELLAIVNDVQIAMRLALPNADVSCVVLEKAPYVHESTYKSGVHLAFPKVFLSFPTYQAVVRIVKTHWANSAVFRQMGQRMNPVLDASEASFPTWLLYGSSKSRTANSGAYTATRYLAYDPTTQATVQQDLDTFMRSCVIYDDMGEVIEYTEPMEFYYPQILSVRPHYRPIIAEVQEERYRVPDQSMERLLEKTIDPEEDLVNLEYISDLVFLLSEYRAVDRNEWMRVGWILYSLTRGADAGLYIWDQFSKLGKDKYNEAKVRDEWSKMRPGCWTLKSLAAMAKEDAPDQFKIVRQKYVDTRIEVALDATDFGIASFFYVMYEGRIVFVRSKEWYFFHYSKEYAPHGYWRLCDENRIKHELTGPLIKYFQKVYFDSVEKMQKIASYDEEAKKYVMEPNADPLEFAKLLRYVTGTHKVLERLKSSSQCASIASMISYLAYDVDNHSVDFGTKKNIVSLQNCVIDTDTCTVRPGTPEDMAILQSGVVYDFNMTDDDPRVKETIDIFTKIFPNVQVREFVLDICAELFVGGNRRKHIYIFTGVGNNGKSVIKQFLRDLLGEYAIDFPTCTMFSSRSSSGLSPDLARSGGGVRMAVVQESNSDDKLNTGAMKELTGNDSMYVRALYSAPKEITPLFKTILICNKLPMLTEDDEAVWNRMVVIPFEAKFTRIPKGQEKINAMNHIYQRDDTLMSRLRTLAPALAYLLLHRLKNVDPDSPVPDYILQRVDNYRGESNYYRRFVDQELEEEDGAVLSTDLLFAKYQTWCRAKGVEHSNIGTAMKFEAELRKILNTKPVDKNWMGYKLKNPIGSDASMSSPMRSYQHNA